MSVGQIQAGAELRRAIHNGQLVPYVGSMVGNRDSRKIVAAVIGLGQSLGLTTVAEGIENQAQAEMLQCTRDTAFPPDRRSN
jgi:hypothetical protein